MCCANFGESWHGSKLIMRPRVAPVFFEKPEDHYGEIWYEMNGQKVMERSTIEPVVLEQIYTLAGIKAAFSGRTTNIAGGYPWAARPRGAAWLFYGLWPLMIGVRLVARTQ